ncbi:MAG: hypothetical protein PHW18_11660 [Sulfuricurvum sp.]|uniref:hypothetical protein n=1 Tax=Sulfuricurvum sp. TaxID=2025608 RepID=UPI00261D3B0E|nr:hypothetical protein [Sulfuricurvum sp.]MDD2830220.1 hypothetical protein [Sulfuricurvum sp.]MDD4950010.1 hypothetical protein [Sulfuricurvum sp.]
MKGKILDFNSEMKSGHVRDENEHKYPFFIGDCKNPQKIKLGANVDFEHDGEKAITITINDSVDDTTIQEENKSKKLLAVKSKKNISILLIAIVILTLGALIAILVLSDIQNKKFKDVEKRYESEINNIKNFLNKEDCSSAVDQYKQASNTRNDLYKYGRYYSIESHAEHAHAIDIAECFVSQNDFTNAVEMLDIKTTNSIDYLNRAAIIYAKAGDSARAQQARNKVREIIP